MRDILSLVRVHAAALEEKGRLRQLKDFRQHGHFSVYDHSLAVAALALKLSHRLHIKTDERALVRGALLHDYFLYDWHVRDRNRPLHGFYHPRAALRNAREDFNLTPREEDIIRHHMFPLTLSPPRTREGLLVCLADKLCAVKETLHRNKKHK